MGFASDLSILTRKRNKKEWRNLVCKAYIISHHFLEFFEVAEITRYTEIGPPKSLLKKLLISIHKSAY